MNIQNLDLSKMVDWTPQQRLKQKRIEAGLTQKQVANILDISLRQWQRYEKDDDICDVTFQLGVNICELLHIDIYEFVIPLKNILENRGEYITPGEIERGREGKKHDKA